jgi:hypothetical protein
MEHLKGPVCSTTKFIAPSSSSTHRRIGISARRFSYLVRKSDVHLAGLINPCPTVVILNNLRRECTRKGVHSRMVYGKRSVLQAVITLKTQDFYALF